MVKIISPPSPKKHMISFKNGLKITIFEGQ